MFRKFLTVSVIVLTFVVTASAQTDWHGFYAGGNVGSVLGRATANTSTVFVFSPFAYLAPDSPAAIAAAGRQKLNSHNFTGGLDAGFYAQAGPVVFGAEADYESLRLNSSQSSSLPYPCCSPTSFAVDQSYNTRWLFTARPKAGYAFGKALLYATGGLAFTRVHYLESFSDTFANASESASFDDTKTGWAGGIGAEYRLTEHRWSAKAEYLYTDFGRTSVASRNLTAFSPPTLFPANVFVHSMALHGHVFRAGVNYHW